jgi:F-type H+-transporting ATPase subunit gamma
MITTLSACCVQASLVAEEVLREGGDAVRVVFNKFHSAISFKPTMATVLNAEVSALHIRFGSSVSNSLDL